MLYIFGDSHAHFSFQNLKTLHQNMYQSSVTMFRIGRDNKIINYNVNIDINTNTILLCYGEVDCRCHIGKQVNLGRNEDEVINELVISYFKTIRNSIKNSKVIIASIIPPTSKDDYERINGPILHEFPFVNSDKDRVRYTNKVNKKLEELCKIYKYLYFDGYSFYKRECGVFSYEFSDNCVHLKNNLNFIEMFYKILV
jgi:hypothetical protein